MLHIVVNIYYGMGIGVIQITGYIGITVYTYSKHVSRCTVKIIHRIDHDRMGKLMFVQVDIPESICSIHVDGELPYFVWCRVHLWRCRSNHL